MLIFIFFIAVLTIGVMITAQQIEVVFDSQLQVESQKVINSMASRINIAFLEGPGFSINMSLPEKIMSYEYSAQIYSNRIFLILEDRSYHGLLLTGNITGTLNLTYGNYLVENRNGGIVIR